MPRQKKGKKASSVKKVSIKMEPTSLQKQTVARLKRQGAVRSVIPMLGSLAGSYLGGPAGGAVGLAAGKLISAITGYGDYTISKNTVLRGNSVPTFRQGGDGVIVSHREFITDVTGSVSFTNTSFPINPGIVTTFPWLSFLGANFEEYELMGLVFEYRPSSGSAVSSTSSALGVVIMATDYDAVNPSFTSKQQMESYEYSTSTVPFTGCLHPVECARNRNVLDNLYLRTGAIPSGADLRLYDTGNFQIATQGMQSVYVVGELWVTYHAAFKKPRIPPGVAPTFPLPFLHLREYPAATASSTSLLGSDPALVLEDTTMDSGTDYVITGFPFGLVLPNPGRYRITVLVHGAGAASAGTLSLGSNIQTGPNLIRDSAVASFFITQNVSSVNYTVLENYIDVVDSGFGDENQINYSSSVSFVDAKADLYCMRWGDWPSRVAGGKKIAPVALRELRAKNISLSRYDTDSKTGCYAPVVL